MMRQAVCLSVTQDTHAAMDPTPLTPKREVGDDGVHVCNAQRFQPEPCLPSAALATPTLSCSTCRRLQRCPQHLWGLWTSRVWRPHPYLSRICCCMQPSVPWTSGAIPATHRQDHLVWLPLAHHSTSDKHWMTSSTRLPIPRPIPAHPCTGQRTHLLHLDMQYLKLARLARYAQNKPPVAFETLVKPVYRAIRAPSISVVRLLPYVVQGVDGFITMTPAHGVAPVHVMAGDARGLAMLACCLSIMDKASQAQAIRHAWRLWQWRTSKLRNRALVRILQEQESEVQVCNSADD